MMQYALSEGFKGGTRGSPIMPRDAVSQTAHVGTVGTNGLSQDSYTTQMAKSVRIPKLRKYNYIYLKKMKVNDTDE